MITPDLIEYIKAERAQGKSDFEIRQALTIGAGWSEGDVTEALNSSRVPAAPEPMKMPQAPEAPKMAAQDTAAPESLMSFSSADHPKPMTSGHSPARKATIAVLILLILILGGAFGYAYWNGGSLFSKAPYAEGELFSGVLDKLQAMKSGTFSYSFKMSTDPREADAAPLVTNQQEQSKKEAMYENDVIRVKDAQKILNAITAINSQMPQGITYVPPTLSDLGTEYRTRRLNYNGDLVFTDPTGNVYSYTSSPYGKTFTLTVNLETQEAVTQIRTQIGSNTWAKIQGKSITFTEGALNKYIYISSSLQKPFLVSVGDLMKSAPANMNLNAKAEVTTSQTDQDSAQLRDFDVTLDATGQFDDLAIAINVAAKKIDSDYYVSINKFPSILFLSIFSPIKGKWIHVNAAEASSSGAFGYSMVSSLSQSLVKTDEAYRKKQQQAKADLNLLVKIADDTKLLAFRRPPLQEKIDGTRLYRYDLAVRKSNLLAFLTRAVAEAQNRKSDLFDSLKADELVAYLGDSATDDTLDYLSKNLFISLWIDNAGIPHRFETRFRVVPPDAAAHLADKQIDLSIDTDFKNINEPVHIVAPDKFISAQEADKLMNSSGPLGDARAKGYDARLISDVQQLRTNAESLYDGVSYAKGLKPSNKSAVHAAGFVMTDKNMKALVDDAASSGSIIYAITNAGPTSYAIYARLVSDSIKYFCIDSSGAIAQSTTKNTGATCR